MGSFTTRGLLVVEAVAGEPRWIAASRITTKATAGQTHGGFGLIVSEVTRDTSSPLHIHHTADESMWVVSGRVRVRCGEDEFPLAAGGAAHVHRRGGHGHARAGQPGRDRGVLHRGRAGRDLGHPSPAGPGAIGAGGGEVPVRVRRAAAVAGLTSKPT